MAHFVVELHGTQTGGVEGTVTMETGEAHRFSGWLELLRLLEAGAAPFVKPDNQ